MTPLDERDLINLNAYLDDELTPGERAAFEQRLALEPTLQQELDAIRTTVAVLKMAERVRVPRNFTLDPKTYGSPAKRSLLDRLGFIGMPQLAAVGGTLVATLICAGLVLYGFSFMGSPAATSVAMEALPAATEEPYAYDQAEAAEETEAPVEETEAPEEEEAEATEAASSDEGFDFATPEPDLGNTGSAGGGAGGGPAGSTGALPTATSGEVSALTLQAVESTNNQRSSTEIAMVVPPQEPEGGETLSIEQTTARESEPTNEPAVDDGTGKIPATPVIPIVPISIVVLVIALIVGGVLARRARRR